MTTGNRITDLRTRVSGSCGSGLCGYTSMKTWSGTDRAPGPKPPPPDVYNVRLYRLVPYITKTGLRKMKREYTDETVERKKFRKLPRRARQSDGEHPYTMQFSCNNDVPIDYVNVGWPEGGVFHGHTNFCGFFFEPSGVSAWTSNDDANLISKLQTKLLGSDFNIGVFLGELPKAATMIANSASRIAAAIHHARKGAWWLAEEALVSGRIPRNGLKRRKGAANSWLELQYGWLPLLDDAYNAAQMIAHMTESPFQNVVRASRSIQCPGGNGSIDYIHARVDVATERHSLKAIIREVNVPQLSGLTDPLQVAWELVPYSFVVDWFIPIGNYLQARNVSSSVSGIFVTTSVYKAHTRGLYSTARTSGNFLYPNNYYRKVIRMSRSVSTSLDVPLPAFKPLAKVASWRHMANAVALLLK